MPSCPAEFAHLIDKLLILLRLSLANGTASTRPVIALTALIASACSPDPVAPKQDDAASRFVGSARCESCHQQEFSQWQGSHHQLAMQVADANTVLGDFSDVTLPYFGDEARFSTRDGKFFVTMQDGAAAAVEFEVTHTFGVTPLQQYLVNVPGGRKQALQFAWDSRPSGGGHGLALSLCTLPDASPPVRL